MSAQFQFEQAIKDGRLSNNPKDEKYAGNYMYMGKSKDGYPMFKNINTRKYIE
ncbi:hypothetical protein LCGC14_1012840 [marine sediment metagenome]|uniref:Uncharacterized protein n=1 Tax=marine sediment metagenome TaxID=412755 RepID=A0A0F9MZV8_9ZZZZ